MMNQFLDAAVMAEHLQWGIKVDDSVTAYKRRVKKKGNQINGKDVEQSSHDDNALINYQHGDARV